MNAAESPDLLFRSQEIFDGAVPAANAVAVLNALALAERTGEQRYRDQAERALTAFAPLVEAQVEATRSLTLAARRFAPDAMAPASAAGGAQLPEPAALPLGDAALRAEAERVVAADARFAGAGRPGDWRPFRVRLRIAPGFHLQPNPAADPAFIATAVEGDGLEVRGLSYPPGERADSAAPVYRGEVEISGEASLLLPSGRLLVTYQACDDARCLPAVTRALPIE